MLDLAQAAQAERRGPLAGLAPIRAANVSVEAGPLLERSVLRHSAPGLPEQVGASVEWDDCAMLCLGPDEWLVLGHCDGDGLSVDVGHRQVVLLVAGAQAEELLNAGCPLDLHASQFPAGACTRTLLGKAEIVLWRRGPELFHVEVARSFTAYAWTFLQTAAAMLP